MKLGFSPAGLKEGALHALKVFLWVAGSGAIFALSNYAQNLNFPADRTDLVLMVALINAILAGALKWLSTHKPTE